jgi:hypothetical protein
MILDVVDLFLMRRYWNLDLFLMRKNWNPHTRCPSWPHRVLHGVGEDDLARRKVARSDEGEGVAVAAGDAEAGGRGDGAQEDARVLVAPVGEEVVLDAGEHRDLLLLRPMACLRHEADRLLAAVWAPAAAFGDAHVRGVELVEVVVAGDGKSWQRVGTAGGADKMPPASSGLVPGDSQSES